MTEQNLPPGGHDFLAHLMDQIDIDPVNNKLTIPNLEVSFDADILRDLVVGVDATVGSELGVGTDMTVGGDLDVDGTSSASGGFEDVFDDTADGTINGYRFAYVDTAGDTLEAIVNAEDAIGVNKSATPVLAAAAIELIQSGKANMVAACPIRWGRNLKVADGGRVCQLVDGVTAGQEILAATAGGGFTNQPANDNVDVVSSDAGDTTQTVTIIGTTNGTDTVVTEDIVLTGLAAATTLKADWGEILAVKMDAAAVGTVTVSETSGGLQITTMAPAAVQSGVVEVTAADQGAHNTPPDAVSDGAATAQVGVQYTQTDGTTVAYMAEGLNGTTAVDFPTAALLVTEVYVGSVPGARTVAVSVTTTLDPTTSKVGKATESAAAARGTTFVGTVSL